MNAGLITETCRIAWWKGYVKGRFVAVLESEARQPEVVGESPSWRWRGSTPPDPTDEARHALDVLTDELVAAGWTLDESQPEVWYERILTRPAIALAAIPDEFDEYDEQDDVPDLRVVAAAEPEPRESQAVARLRSELVLALDEVERQQRLRSEAEEQARRVASRPTALAAAPTAAAAAPLRPRRRQVLWILLELASVGAAAAIFLVVLDSTYAAVVAGLTTGAVVLALDSLFAVRSGRDAPPRAAVTLVTRDQS
jgi:hypothetical protein